jgi:hypothetical protein
MPSHVLATRLPEPLRREVRDFAKRHRLGPSEALRAIVAEWAEQRAFPSVEFRDGPGGRRAALRNGPELWEVALIAGDAGDDVEALRGKLGSPLPAESLREALAYIAGHREDMESWAEAYRRAGQERRRASSARVETFEAERVLRAAVAGMTVERKLEVAHGLRELAWETKAAAIRSDSPGLSEADVQERVREVFLDAVR